MLGLSLWDERPRHRFHHAATGKRAPRAPRALLPVRQNRPRHAVAAVHRRRWNLVEAVDTDDLLDEVGRTMDVRPPRRRRHLPLRSLALHVAADRLQDGPARLRAHVDAREAPHLAEVERDDVAALRHLSRHLGLRRRAAAHLEQQVRREVQPGHDEGGIDATLETVARIGDDAGLPARLRRPGGIEVGAFNEHVGRLFGAARRLPADHAAEAQNAAIVGNDAHLVVDRVALVVERLEALAGLAEPGPDRALDLVGVVDVQRPAAVERDVVRHVDQRTDRPQPGGLQALLHPVG